ncbi:MAG: GIY-YIG nuclease family protein [Candidatus Latescibacterota bacterium]
MKLLKNFPVRALDCQATGPHPDTGFLLEIGWAKIRASGADFSTPDIESYLFPLPEGAAIPRRVSAITGIIPEDLSTARPAAVIWGRLAEAVKEICLANDMELCPTVIHYSRYEEPFLRAFHQAHSPESLFPFSLICTHEIAKRLLPDLPRRGIRAVAGYFGHSTAELRRAGRHVSATIRIWKEMVELLDTKCEVRTLDELQQWLADTPGFCRTGRAYPMDRDIRLGLPDQPGVYRMLRSNGDILYVGKADSLKRRVNSYFQKRSRHAEHILEMLSQARNLDVSVTGSALEAAMLESDEIKRLAPPYNISLRAGLRTLRFCSGDLRDCSPEADDRYPFGPFPSDDLQTFPIIIELLRGNAEPAEESDIASKALNIPEEYAPGRECFLQGFTLFSQKHSAIPGHAASSGTLLMLGSQLWRERMEKGLEAEEANESTEENAEPAQPADGREWTPETTVNALEEVILRGAWLLRRARWFCLLSESALCFRENPARERKNRILIMERGIITRREDTSPEIEIPVPPGYNKLYCERQKSFDLPAYDRMRVLTTELRRIFLRGGDIMLRLTPRALLPGEKVKQALSWI